MKTISMEAFRGCKSLKSLEFVGESALEVIPARAFLGCACLELLILPAGLRTIEGAAFGDCVMISCVRVVGGAPKFNPWASFPSVRSVQVA